MSKNLKEMIALLMESFDELSQLLKGSVESFKEQNEAFLQTSDVARLLNMSERTIQRYAKRGLIKCKLIGGTNFYSKSDVFTLLKGH